MYTVLQTEEFQSWLDDLSDKRAQIRISARLRLPEAGNLGDWGPVGGPVSELRVDFGPGYRLPALFHSPRQPADNHARRRRQVVPETGH